MILSGKLTTELIYRGYCIGISFGVFYELKN
jgi:hypothetical protein